MAERGKEREKKINSYLTLEHYQSFHSIIVNRFFNQMRKTMMMMMINRMLLLGGANNIG